MKTQEQVGDGGPLDVMWVHIKDPGHPNGGYCRPALMPKEGEGAAGCGGAGAPSSGLSGGEELTGAELAELEQDFPAVAKLARCYQRLRADVERLERQMDLAPSAARWPRGATYAIGVLVLILVAWIAWPASRQSCLDEASRRSTDMGVRAAVLACEEKFPKP